jgi:hypothetical protein
MTDENMERAKEIDDAVKAADAKKRADAEAAAVSGSKLDQILDCLASLGSRMDAYDKDRGEREGEEIKDPGDPEKLGADSAVVRKDSAAASDLEEIEHFKREVGTTRPVAADSVIAEIQSHAARAANSWGKDAKHPWDGEGITAYRRRVAREHQQYSSQWKNVDLHTLDGQALRNATAQIFADSIAASTSPDSYGETLREVRRRDPVTGQVRIEFYGNPSAWTDQFKSGRQFVTKFRTGARYNND